MLFEDYNLEPEILKNLSKLGFKKPTDIQYKSIPSIMRGEDVLAIAQTGTGKTAAFAIPIIQKIHSYKKDARRKDGIKCLIMVPTHELAIQIAEVINKMARHTLVQAMSLFGGVAQEPQIDRLEKGADVLVTTPGRMFDLHSQGHLRLHRVETLILDEADHMLALGFVKDIHDVLGRLPKRRQTLFFSATINPKIKQTAYSIVKNTAIRIQISPKNPVAKTVHHQLAFIEMDDKRFFLERLHNDEKNSKILVFVRTKVRAERVCKAMERVGILSLTIHGSKTHNERADVLNKFKEGTPRMLIATDVSARGIDIPDVDIVINYDMPELPENYVHRVGRTGRAGKKGHAIAFCSPEEKEILESIEIYLGKEIDIINIDRKLYKETLDTSKDTRGLDWNYLLEQEIQQHEAASKKARKKRNPKSNKKKRK